MAGNSAHVFGRTRGHPWGARRMFGGTCTRCEVVGEEHQQRRKNFNNKSYIC
jgi:hypothetical protein